MAENADAMKKKGHKSKFSLKGLLNQFSKKKSSINEEYSAQVHPTIPYELSQAWEIARPYRPCLILNLQTIREEEADPSKTPMSLQGSIRTPLYFTKGSNTKRFRFRLRRYAKFIWRVHYGARVRRNFTSVLRFFRMRRDTKAPADAAGLSVIQI